MVDVVLQILNQVGVGIVRHEDMGCALDGRHQAREAGASAQFQDGFTIGYRRVGFEKVGEDAASVPEVMPLEKTPSVESEQKL